MLRKDISGEQKTKDDVDQHADAKGGKGCPPARARSRARGQAKPKSRR